MESKIAPSSGGSLTYIAGVAKMEIEDRVAIVTGGANGIGEALCRRFTRENAAGIVVADLDLENAQRVAKEVDGIAIACDVASEQDHVSLVEKTLEKYGRIDIFCANAGITVKGGCEVEDEKWQKMWDVNVMSNVYAMRTILPQMLKQGEGYFVTTASAAGLLTEIGSAPYSVTKHASVAFAEWLWIHHSQQGIGVSCVCPLGVETAMLDLDDPIHRFLQVSAISADEVAETILAGIREERFMILPHPQVQEFFCYKAEDHGRWLKGMRRLNEKLARRKAA